MGLAHRLLSRATMRYSILLSSVVTALSLVACGGDTPAAQSADDAAADSERAADKAEDAADKADEKADKAEDEADKAQ